MCVAIKQESDSIIYAKLTMRGYRISMTFTYRKPLPSAINDIFTGFRVSVFKRECEE